MYLKTIKDIAYKRYTEYSDIEKFKLGKEAKNPIKYEEAKQKFDSIMQGI